MQFGSAIWKCIMGCLTAILGTTITDYIWGPDDFKLVILHVNDMHSRVEPIDADGNVCKEGANCYGGFARLKWAADQERLKYEIEGWNVIFLNAGDWFQGTPYFNVHGWRVFEALMPDFKFDVSCLGNHEFDNGPGFLVDYLKVLKKKDIGGPVICGNIDTSQEKKFDDYTLLKKVVLTIKGRKIGIVGYLTPDTQTMSDTGDTKLEEEVAAIEREITELKKEGVNIIIALGHSGYTKDLDIAARALDVDVVVGGHTNTFLYTGAAPDSDAVVDVYPKMVTGKRTGADGEIVDSEVPVVQARYYTKYLGVLKVEFNREGVFRAASGNPILLDKSIPEDSKMLEKITPWKNELGSQLSRVIAKTEVDLVGTTENCRHKECNLGNLVADSLVDYFESHPTSITRGKGVIAVVHAGSIRASIKTGEITYGNLLVAFPFNNRVKVLKITGETLRKALEHSVSTFKPGGLNSMGNYLQMSGIKAYYDFSKPVNSRLKLAMIKCDAKQTEEAGKSCYNKLDVNKEYFMAATTEVIKGMDGFQVVKDNHQVAETFDKTQMETLLAYLEKKKVVKPVLEGRSVFLAEGETVE